MTDKGTDCEPAVCRVGVKIPPFWRDNPELWFCQIEGQFELAGITADSTKYYHVISVLDPKYATEVEDIIKSPPAAAKYATLKRELIARSSASRSEQLKRLMTLEELGDRKPSQFLRHIRNLAGDGYPDEFVRSVWSSRLPTLLQSLIAMQDDTTSLDKLAGMADKAYEASSLMSTPHVSAASTSSMLCPVVDELNQKIEALATKLDAMSTPARRREFRPRTWSRPGERGRSRSRSRAGAGRYCWYHYMFADKAAKCIPPCSYPKN